MRKILQRLGGWFRRLGRVFLRRGFMRVRAYPVLCERVEAGVVYGWNRAHKHTKRPKPEDVQAAIVDAVLADLCEWFDFPDDNVE